MLHRRTRLRFARLRLSRLALVLACGMTGAFTVQPCAAQDAKELSQARAKFQQALELKQAGNWPAALRLLREVGQVRMTPQVRYHIAGCEEKLGKLVAALGGYELALADAEGMHPDFVAEVQASVEDLKARIPKLLIERGEGAEAATIELDGVSLGNSSIGVEVPVDPGPHTLSAQAPGRRPFSKTVNVSEEGTLTVTVTLASLASADEEPDESSSPSSSTPTEEGPRYGALPYVLGGIGTAGLVTSGVFLALNRSKVSGLGDRCPERDCSALSPGDRDAARADYDTARTHEIVMWSTLGVGAAALGTGLVLYLLDQKPNQEVVRLPYGFAVRADAPASDAGLSISGAF